MAGAAAVRHWPALLALRTARAESLLGSVVRARSEVWSLLLAPFISVTWSAGERLRRLVGHCRAAEQLGAPFDLRPHEYAELLSLDEVAAGLRLTLDQPRWLFRDGLIALSLWEGEDRIFSLTFLLAEAPSGLVAYVGGVQGMRDAAARERYRALTKQAHGMRPADLLIELFRMIAGEIDVRRILCVSDATRHQRSSYFTARDGFADPVTLDYDAIWTERGATLRRDGLFLLPLVAPYRDEAEIAPRKRALYRRRRHMLAGIAARMRATLRRRHAIPILQHDPQFL